MITLKQYFETINYKISTGYSYQWRCYGANAYGLDCITDGWSDGSSINIIFDTENQTVYQVEAHDYKNNRSYRMIHPDFSKAHSQECIDRDIPDVAYDEVKFTDLEIDEDFIEKATAIIKGEDYDTRVSIPLDLPDSLLFTLMKQAHEKDITLNDHMENVLREAIELLGAKHGISS